MGISLLLPPFYLGLSNLSGPTSKIINHLPLPGQTHVARTHDYVLATPASLPLILRHTPHRPYCVTCNTLSVYSTFLYFVLVTLLPELQLFLT